MYDTLHIRLLHAVNVHAVLRILPQDFPVRKNKTIGDDRRAGFQFPFEFFGQPFHFPGDEIYKNHVRVMDIGMPEIFPVCTRAPYF